MSERQLTLDLGHRPAFGLDDFLVAPSNSAAVAWLDRWPDWPGSGLAVHGPAGCGKSHCVQVWRANAGTGAAVITAAELTLEGVPELAGRPVAVEDCDGGFEERALLHLYNLQRETGGHLLVTGRQAPARWQVALADLASRLKTLPSVAMGAPDDALLQAVMVKLLADRQLRVGQDVVQFLLARMRRSFDAAAEIVAALDQVSLAAKRKITVPLAAQVLIELREKR